MIYYEEYWKSNEGKKRLAKANKSVKQAKQSEEDQDSIYDSIKSFVKKPFEYLGQQFLGPAFRDAAEKLSPVIKSVNPWDKNNKFGRRQGDISQIIYDLADEARISHTEMGNQLTDDRKHKIINAHTYRDIQDVLMEMYTAAPAAGTTKATIDPDRALVYAGRIAKELGIKPTKSETADKNPDNTRHFYIAVLSGPERVAFKKYVEDIANALENPSMSAPCRVLATDLKTAEAGKFNDLSTSLMKIQTEMYAALGNVKKADSAQFTSAKQAVYDCYSEDLQVLKDAENFLAIVGTPSTPRRARNDPGIDMKENMKKEFAETFVNASNFYMKLMGSSPVNTYSDQVKALVAKDIAELRTGIKALDFALTAANNNPALTGTPDLINAFVDYNNAVTLLANYEKAEREYQGISKVSTLEEKAKLVVASRLYENDNKELASNYLLLLLCGAGNKSLNTADAGVENIVERYFAQQERIYRNGISGLTPGIPSFTLDDTTQDAISEYKAAKAMQSIANPAKYVVEKSRSTTLDDETKNSLTAYQIATAALTKIQELQKAKRI